MWALGKAAASQRASSASLGASRGTALPPPPQASGWASSPPSLKYSQFCSGVFSPCSLHHLDTKGSATLLWEEEEDGEAAALPRSGASELRISSWMKLQLTRTTTGGRKKNHNSLCKTQNYLKGVCVWWGVPRGGRVAVGGWGCGWVKQTNWVRGSFLFNSRSGRTHGVGSSVHVNSTLSLSPKLGAKIQRFTLVLGRYRRRTELCSSETTEQKFLKHH